MAIYLIYLILIFHVQIVGIIVGGVAGTVVLLLISAAILVCRIRWVICIGAISKNLKKIYLYQKCGINWHNKTIGMIVGC